jgi:hypothetical protein
MNQLEDQEAVAWVWPIIQDVCVLPDPQLFPRFEYEWDSEDLAMLRRYVGVCKRLVATTVMNSNARVSVSMLQGTVTKVVPADDATIGFVALQRQLFKPDEEASFDRVRKLLSRRAYDADARDAGEVLGRWKRAHQTLLTKHLRALIEDMARSRNLLQEDEDSQGARLLISEDITPAALLEVFLHGDLIHWGEEDREHWERWQKDERTAAMMEINMRTDANTLAHFYAGFAGLVRLSLDGEDVPPAR